MSMAGLHLPHRFKLDIGSFHQPYHRLGSDDDLHTPLLRSKITATDQIEEVQQDTNINDGGDRASRTWLQGLQVHGVLGRLKPRIRQKQPFRFLDLPRELRDETYFHYFFSGSHDPSKVPTRLRRAGKHPTTTVRPRVKRIRNRVLNLLNLHETPKADVLNMFLISRAIKAESEAIYFSHCILMLPPRHARKIKALNASTFWMPKDIPTSVFQNIRYVNISCAVTDLPSSEVLKSRTHFTISSDDDLAVFDANGILLPSDRDLYHIWNRNLHFVMAMPRLRRLCLDIRRCNWKSDFNFDAPLSESVVVPATWLVADIWARARAMRRRMGLSDLVQEVYRADALPGQQLARDWVMPKIDWDIWTDEDSVNSMKFWGIIRPSGKKQGLWEW